MTTENETDAHSENGALKICQCCREQQAYAIVSIDGGQSSQLECVDCSRDAFDSEDEDTIAMVLGV